MRRIYALIILLLCTAAIMAAQETPKFELFGGYSFAHVNTGANLGRHSNLNGWNSSLAYNFNKWVGIVLDGSGTYRSGQLSPATTIVFVCPGIVPTCPPPFNFGPVNQSEQVHTSSIGRTTDCASPLELSFASARNNCFYHRRIGRMFTPFAFCLWSCILLSDR